MTLKLKKSKYFIFFIFLASSAFPTRIGVIKNPKPNMVEKKYVQLEKIKIIEADISGDEYLFKPHSLTIDKNSNLYVYDNLQCKILKFDKDLKFIKSFGGEGEGPGEFSGTGKLHPVYIRMGRDGKLYAKDLRTRKINIYDPNGNFINQIKYLEEYYNPPVVNSNGDIHTFKFRNSNIEVHNKAGKKFLSLTIEFVSRDLNYLFFKPPFISNNPKYFPKILLTDFTLNSTLMIFFIPSSTMFIIKGNKIEKKMNLWPRDALYAYKTELSGILRKNKDVFKNLFLELFTDGDDENIFYLQFGRNQNREINALYQFDLHGRLLKVLYVKLKDTIGFTKFRAKKSECFYAIEDNQIKIYKEVYQ